jgi:tRNA(Arg) A34 adenosine deaminase TadA
MDDLIAYSIDHVHAGGIPFTAFVIDADGNTIGRGVNRVLNNNDPTAHAEVEAIRDACHTAKTPSLNGTRLLASGEPCAMCYLNALFAGVDEVIYAADRNDAAAAGFDYRSSYQMLANFPELWPMKVRKLCSPNAFEPFKLWRRKRNLI